MKCQMCQHNQASVRITELTEPPTETPVGNGDYTERFVCEVCAQKLNVLHGVVAKEFKLDIFKLIQSARQSAGLTCAGCGWSLADFKQKGRLGCAQCYETFAEQLEPLLQRMHNATSHTGRLPGIDEAQLQRIQQLSELRGKLESAIREEQYENAAQLRDELKQLESESENG